MHEEPKPIQESEARDTGQGESELGFGQVFHRLGPAAWLGILWSTAPAILGFWLLASVEPVSQWLDSHGSMGLVVYITVFALSAGAGLLPTYAQAIVGGWVFGFWAGSLAALVGFTAACILGRLIAQLAAQDRVQRLVERHPRSALIRRALIGRGFWQTLTVVTLIRIPPNSPFALTNLLLSSVGVRWVPYVVGTAVGMAPRTMVAAALASGAAAAGNQDIQSFFKDSKSVGVFFVSILIAVVVIAIIGAIANHALKRMTDESRAAQPSA